MPKPSFSSVKLHECVGETQDHNMDYVTGECAACAHDQPVIVALTQYLTRILLIGPRHEWRAIAGDVDLFGTFAFNSLY